MTAPLHQPLAIRGLASADMGESPLPPNWVPQVTNCLVVDVPVDSQEWRKVCERFHTSLKESLHHVIRVERIQVGHPS